MGRQARRPSPPPRPPWLGVALLLQSVLLVAGCTDLWGSKGLQTGASRKLCICWCSLQVRRRHWKQRRATGLRPVAAGSL